MANGILSLSLEGNDEFLYRHIGESMDFTQGELLDSEALRFTLVKIEKITEELISKGVHGGCNSFNEVSASTEGFMFALGVAWELEPSVTLSSIDQALESENTALEGFYENIIVNGCSASTLRHWGELSDAGLEGVQGMYNLLRAATPELGYNRYSPEADNITFWGGLGTSVFLRAAEKHMIASFSEQLDLIKSSKDLDKLFNDDGTTKR